MYQACNGISLVKGFQGTYNMCPINGFPDLRELPSDSPAALAGYFQMYFQLQITLVKSQSQGIRVTFKLVLQSSLQNVSAIWIREEFPFQVSQAFPVQ